VKSTGLWGAALLLVAACATGPRSRPLEKGVSFTGHWDSNFHEMDLHQQGARVWGTVNYKDGSIEGRLDGDVLRFRWSQRENQQHGRGYLQISADGSRLEGRWGYEASEDDGGRWWAERADVQAPPKPVAPTVFRDPD
jgi:hypothetical protein